MKTTYYYLILSALAVFFMNSCDSDEQVDTLIDNVERGAILRTVQIISNEFPFDAPDTALFSVELEEQDQEDGALLESVDFFVTFTDGSPTEGNTGGGLVGQEVFVRTVAASEFTTGPNGLPRFTYTATLTELLALVNLSADNIFGGDVFRTRLELNLTDGRSFTNDGGDNVDVNGNVASGSFFLSPFFYNTPVVCPVGEDEFIGEYVLSNGAPTDFGNVFREGQVVTLVAGETSVARSFDAIILEDLDPTFPVITFSWDHVCNEIIVAAQQDTGLGCGGGTLFLGPPGGEALGTYVTGDDSTFTIIVGYNISGEATCSAPQDITLTLSRQ